MKAVIAIDSFKGCLSSQEAVKAAASAFAPNDEVICKPISDGGEGFTKIVSDALGGQIVSIPTFDPLGRAIAADIALIDNGKTAIIETAAASGLNLLKPTERDVQLASSFGTGVLIKAAIMMRVKNIILGLGGSATNDGGKGLLDALGVRFDGNAIASSKTHIKSGVSFKCFYDSNVHFYGPNGATYLYAPQKGCPSEKLGEMDLRMRGLCNTYSIYSGKDIQNAPGAGAAGGIGGAMHAVLDAKMIDGITGVLRLIDFEKDLGHCDLVITGEGKADLQTLTGKAPKGTLDYVRQYKHKGYKINVVLVAGKIENRNELLDAGFDEVIQVTPDNMPISVAIQPEMAEKNIQASIKNYLSIHYLRQM